MSRFVVMTQKALEMLNPVEVALLILAAHLHDQRMVREWKKVPDTRRYDALTQEEILAILNA